MSIAIAIRAHGSIRAFLVPVILAASVTSLGAGIASLAVWTDSDTASGSFTTGTVDLAVSPSTVFAATGIGPGESGSAALTVSNSGTMAVRYALSTSATNGDGKALRDQLEMTVSAGTCPGTTVLYGPASLASVGFGSAAQGADTGDRTLAAGASEVLCFAWSLPSSTGDAYQGAATTATFTFASEQTAGNP